jgi:hypothetical protein
VEKAPRGPISWQTDTESNILEGFMALTDMKWRSAHPYSLNSPKSFEKVFKERLLIFERYLTAVSCVMNHYE